MGRGTCSIVDCTTNVHARGLCSKHYRRQLTDTSSGTRAVCVIVECNRGVYARGWCNTHYQRWRTTGDPLFVAPPRPTCSLEGCEKSEYRRGWCRTHYNRWKKHGDPLWVNPPRPPRQEFCSIEGCDAKLIARLWCAKHYDRWRRYGDPQGVPPPKPPRPPRPTVPCSIPECDRVATKRGWCHTHYWRWQKHGDPEYVRPPSARGRPPIPCSVADCGTLAERRGWCRKHYQNWTRYGDPIATQGEPPPSKANTECSVGDCRREAVGRGWCRTHYSRWQRTGNPEYEPPTCSVDGCKTRVCRESGSLCGKHHKKSLTFGDPNWTRPRAGETKCSIDGCVEPAVARGWCRRHWGRWQRNGDPVAPKRRADLAVDYEDGTRLCRTCGDRLPLDQFDKDKSATGGRKSKCKACRSEQMKSWHDKNRERIRKRMKQYREDDPEKVRQIDRKRYERDREKRIARAIEQVHIRRQRILKQGTLERGISVSALRKLHGDQCCYCGITMIFKTSTGRTFLPDKATIEHVLPLSMGGAHEWDNCRLSCWQCNIRKNNKLADEWQPDAPDEDGLQPIEPPWI